MHSPNEAITIPVSSLRRILFGVAAVAVVILVLTVAWQERARFESFFARGIAAQVDRNSYQAVFLTGGQVYFGKATVRENVVLLSEVYYLGNQTQQNPVGQLVKRGAELHAPREPMIIPESQVLFIENLREDSQVVQAIQRFLSGEQPAPAAPGGPAAPAGTPPPGSPSPSPSPSPTPSPTPRATPTR